MTYPDIVKLATVEPDMYGDRTVTSFDEVAANFIQKSGFTHRANTEGDTSDATVYLSPTDARVLSRQDDLEGMYLTYEGKWYRVTTASVAKRKLLNNAVDNVYCHLEKVAGMNDVRVS